MVPMKNLDHGLARIDQWWGQKKGQSHLKFRFHLWYLSVHGARIK